MPKTADSWPLILREPLVRIGVKAVRHVRYVPFRMAEVVVLRQMFADILALIARLWALPVQA